MRALLFDDDTSGMLSELCSPNYKAVQQENPLQIWSARPSKWGWRKKNERKKERRGKGKGLKMKKKKKEKKVRLDLVKKKKGGGGNFKKKSKIKNAFKEKLFLEPHIMWQS